MVFENPFALLMYCGNVMWADFRVAGFVRRKTARKYLFLYGKPRRHAQPHTNAKPVFAGERDLARIAENRSNNIFEKDRGYKG